MIGEPTNVTISEIICKKRDGFELTTEEIKFFIDSVVKGTADDAQIGAMLMAVFLNNINYRETLDLTRAMIESGDILRLDNFSSNVLVDKHSTGGVGDKISLILVPTLVACGLKVPMISGWSLGYTGGTLDKLQSIPGFQVSLSVEQMKHCLIEAGCFIASATNSFAPADAILYRIRDKTSTVENSGLIAASILSKKAAEGIGTLVVDIKFGQGSFSKTEEEAQKLAKIIVKIGEELNMIVRVIISEMNFPLGRFVGNSLEIVESIKCLKNEVDNEVTNLVKFLGGVLLESKGMANTIEEGKDMISKTLQDGSALNSFKKMLISQGVSKRNASQICSGSFQDVLPNSKHITFLLSSKNGVITKIGAMDVGKACWHLGGGRTESGTPIDYSVGVVLLKDVGEKVGINEPWIEVHHTSLELPSKVKDLLNHSLTVEPNPANSQNIEKKESSRIKLFR